MQVTDIYAACGWFHEIRQCRHSFQLGKQLVYQPGTG